MDTKPQRNILVTSSPDILPFLRKELEELKYPARSSISSGVFITGDADDTMFLNLHLRTAHHVLLLLEEFNAGNPQELYQKLYRLPWEEIIPDDGYVCVYSNVETATITDGRYANLKCKDAIVDRLLARTGRRPDSGPARDRAVIYLHWKGHRAAVFLDSSGQTLARRGYRKIPFKAPMQENLASAVILSSIWNRGANFINPMCGSGTLAIEAALIALNRAPGMLRENFGFMHVKGFDRKTWQKLKKQALAMETQRIESRIIATDIDPSAIHAARRNAAEAGVERFIEFSVCDFAQSPIPPGNGVVVLNPEYGVRMGNSSALETLYSRIGDFFKKKCQGYTGYVFSGNLMLLKKVGLRTSRRLIFRSGGIDCRLHEYALYRGTEPTSA